jgi:ATP-binding cassette subfamily F protein 3
LFPQAPHSGKVTIEGIDISKNYGDNKILSNIDFEIIRGEKIAFLGRNGEGKSTLIRIIANDLDFNGTLKLGHQVVLSYFAQDQGDKLDLDSTVFETLDKVAVGEIRKRIKSILGAFLFRGDDVDKKVKVLSGGEKSRLALATMLLTPSNLLLLDEPTNHLDMRSKDILKNALLQYEGTVVIVSHDRDFLTGLTTRMYEFKDKKINEFRGDIEEFIDKRKLASLHELESKQIVNSRDKTNSSNKKSNWENKKEVEKKSRKIRSDINKIEKQISSLENNLNLINEKLSNPDKYFKEIKSGELYKAHDEVNLKLNEAYNSWELKTDQLDKV